ncbi:MULTISPECIES: hypothetical protein [unclassified Arsukibacterium]|uniref:hypothetical protein n=1 Tax=unclassified Arsukibacterium TaxID=2635278 RepID=UPI000C8F90EE|nr:MULTISPECIES: hypothetical protein [unclassified Arsukibacterium]MAA95696.1 hypothetical protein [Rheinheimera sp.]HAW92650.1 hypothetical protein [Candidatus Azambacteria bacterium]|tara:strand:+ start:1793 stop:2092 length:300 start_codon:yes stop_codon:yes gene_type:complete
MPSVTDLLNQVAIRLQQEGKTPSLALFKARLSGQLTAPALFSAYQQWRKQPALPDIAELPAEDKRLTESVPDDAASQLQRIEAKLDRILALLEQQHVSG